MAGAKAVGYVLTALLTVTVLAATGDWHYMMTVVALVWFAARLGRMSVLYPRVLKYGVRMVVRPELLAPGEQRHTSECLGDFRTQAEAQSFIEEQWVEASKHGVDPANPMQAPATWEIFEHLAERKAADERTRKFLDEMKRQRKSRGR
jgi:hypothetical protein